MFLQFHKLAQVVATLQLVLQFAKNLSNLVLDRIRRDGSLLKITEVWE